MFYGGNMEQEIQQADSSKYSYENLQSAIKLIASGEFDVKKFYGLDDNCTEAIYAYGYQIFQQKKYDKAMQIFSVLCFLDKNNEKYFEALASASMLAENYIAAMMAYTTLMALGHVKPKYFYGLGECCLKLNKNEEAKKYFQASIDYINNMGENFKAENIKMFNGTSAILDALKAKSEVKK